MDDKALELLARLIVDDIIAEKKAKEAGIWRITLFGI
jgi:hypothetical protein